MSGNGNGKTPRKPARKGINAAKGATPRRRAALPAAGGPAPDSGARVADTASFVLERIDARVPVRDGAVPATAELERRAAVALAAEEELVYLFYDIPSRHPSTGKAIANPSGLLRWYGFRMNLSCWCLRRRDIDAGDVADLLSYWDALGCIWFHVAPQPREQNATHRRIARARLEEEMRTAHRSLITRLANADDAYARAKAELAKTPEASSAKDYEYILMHRDGNVWNALRTVGETMRAAVTCAEIFDATEAVKPLADGLTLALRAETEAFNAYMLAKGATPGKLAPAV